VRVWNL